MSDNSRQKDKKNHSRPDATRKNKYGLSKKTKTKKDLLEEAQIKMFKI